MGYYPDVGLLHSLLTLFHNLLYFTDNVVLNVRGLLLGAQ